MFGDAFACMRSGRAFPEMEEAVSPAPVSLVCLSQVVCPVSDRRTFRLFRTSSMPHTPSVLFIGMLVLGSALPVLAGPPDLAAFEPVLIPVYGQSSGALGSQFSATARVVGPFRFPYYSGGAGTEAVHLYDGLGQFMIEPRVGPPGRVVYVERSFASRVWLHGVLDSTDQSGHNSRTLLPIVREKDFLTGTSVLFPLSSAASHRNRLRIYSLAPVPVRFKIGACIMALGAFNDCLATVEVVTTPAPQDDPSIPGYTELDLTSLVRCIVLLPHSGCVDEDYRISIEPEDASSPYWALASSTDNETQQIELFQPQ
jgi:hypothetical protein